MLRGTSVTQAVSGAETDVSAFRRAVEKLAPYDLQVVEFYTTSEHAGEYGKIVRENGYIPVFHNALDQKRSGWCRLCAEDEDVRLRSVDLTKLSLEKALEAGAVRSVIQSGTMPEDHALEGECLAALARSLEELHAFTGDALVLSLEPCDRSIMIRQLLGPALETATFMRELKVPGVGLTVDISHCRLLFEDPVETIRLLKPFCTHIHIANSCVKPGDPLFGDTHPLFSYPNGTMSSAQAREIFEFVRELYG